MLAPAPGGGEQGLTIPRPPSSITALVRVLLYVDDPAEIHDANGICVFVNPAWCRTTGQRPEEVVGKPAPQLPPRDVRRILLHDESGSRAHSVILRRDTARTARDHASERDPRFDRAIRGAEVGLWELELATGHVLASARCLELVALPSEETTLPVVKQMAHPDDIPRVMETLRHQPDGARDQLAVEIRLRDPSGAWRWRQLRAHIFYGVDGRPERVAGGMYDIQDRKDAQERLVLLASRDSLTNLLNRRAFVERMEQAASRARRRASANFAVLYVDLRKFKQVNDQYGHEVGDDLLRSVATRLLAAVRPGDSVARLGGDEFGLLLEPVGSEQHMIAAAQRVERALATPFPLGNLTLQISGTVGAVMGDTSGNIDALIRDADSAMYTARLDGGSGHRVADADMRARIHRRSALAVALPIALRRNQLRVVFQPLVQLDTRRPFGMEALIRWQHTEFGQVRPQEIVELADELGLGTELGLMVLGQAVTWLLAARRSALVPDDFVMNVNANARLLLDQRFEELVEVLRRTSGLAANMLNLEINESALLQRSEEMVQVMERFRSVGIGFVLDDFGTGWSSLVHLRKFPVRCVKIDRSFTRACVHDRPTAEIVRGLVGIADALGMQVVAEGIEEEAELARMLELGCRYGQGYLFAHPAVAEDAVELMRGW